MRNTLKLLCLCSVHISPLFIKHFTSQKVCRQSEYEPKRVQNPSLRYKNQRLWDSEVVNINCLLSDCSPSLLKSHDSLVWGTDQSTWSSLIIFHHSFIFKESWRFERQRLYDMTARHGSILLSSWNAYEQQAAQRPDNLRWFNRCQCECTINSLQTVRHLTMVQSRAAHPQKWLNSSS